MHHGAGASSGTILLIGMVKLPRVQSSGPKGPRKAAVSRICRRFLRNRVPQSGKRGALLPRGGVM